MKPQTEVSSEADLVGSCSEIGIPVEIVAAVEKKILRMKTPKVDSEISYTPSSLSWCLRLQQYAKMGFPKEILDSESEDPFASGFSFFRGDALHTAFARIYRWAELPLKREFKISDTRSVIISGRLDMYQPNRKEILDLKTTRFLGWQKQNKWVPRIKDIQQLQIYYAIYSDELLPVEKLTLLYVDMKEIVAFDVPIMADAKNWLRNRIEMIEKSIDEKTVVKAEPSKMCDWCPHQSRCYNDGNGLITKPKSHKLENLK